MKENSPEKLIGKSSEEYGDKYHEHLLEQYKLYVEMTDNISERRQSANNYFLAVDSAIISLYSILSGSNLLAGRYAYFIPLAGFLISITWLTLIRSYRQINSGKFKVIHMIESQLASAPYDTEWRILRKGRWYRYIPFTYVEQIVPLIFSGIYILLMIASL